ncbi:MAG: hypothetical protein Q8L45_02370 [Xanthomonadaceae bacterium]|nr:hypothetical protein [Xanthomonadaceae bacterium]MDP2185985.1 hypothetical protein [Xanthomonadales bacterium]MDZ4116133.1 hypothetical protein [Xanthomonadaceae bacterium]MDZ4378483.1 hypothetical protein [Xanthomonadaceae bacterium]
MIAACNSTEAIAANINTDCAALYASGFTAVEGMVAAPSPSSSRPAKGVPFKDPAFGTCVVRATNHASEPPSGFARNDYSRRQAFNVDNTRVLVYALNGAWHLYDANSLAPLKVLNGPAGDAEPQWHPTEPNSLYWIPINGGMVLNKLNVETNLSTKVADFTDKLPWSNVTRVWSKSEGSPSADGRYWCFMAETSSFGIRGVFIYDLQTQSVLGTRNLSSRPDHVSMSPSGRYCVISGGDVSNGTVAWDRTFSNSRVVHHGGEHSDLALGPDGSDYYVAVDYQSSGGDLYMVNLSTGLRTVLFPTYIQGTATAYHISGKNFSRPGWVLMSTYARSGAEKWLHERVMAVELKASPRIINLAHHHTRYNGYWTEPHASVSRDFTHVLFSSNWGTSSDLDVDAFMIRLPDSILDPSGSAPQPLQPTDKYVWTLPSSFNSEQQGFVRLRNLENRSGEVMVWGIDATGHRSPGTMSLTLGPNESHQFNSQDLEFGQDVQFGNTNKGLVGSIGTGVGNWTLVIRSDLDVEPLSYIRTPDGFLTAMHDRVSGDGVDWLVPIFNPAQNLNQLSRLRVINTNLQAVGVQISGRDDSGRVAQATVTTTLAPLASIELSSVDMENGNPGKGLLGKLGDGEGKWQLTVSATGRVTVQSLLFDPLGKLTNLSTVADLSQPLPGEHVLWMLPPAANTQQQGFVRLVNRENRSGEVRVWGVDDDGRRSTGTMTLTLAPNESRQFNSLDLENGNPDKGLSGSLGVGSGNWRLLLQSDLNLLPMALIRTPDGFLTTIHDIVSGSGLITQVPTFNPAENLKQVSSLRLINPNAVATTVTISGQDDEGQPAPNGAITLLLPAGSARDLSASDIELGNTLLGGKGIGNGSGKWMLTVTATQPIKVMSLLRDPGGILTNLSTANKGIAAAL